MTTTRWIASTMSSSRNPTVATTRLLPILMATYSVPISKMSFLPMALPVFRADPLPIILSAIPSITPSTEEGAPILSWVSIATIIMWLTTWQMSLSKPLESLQAPIACSQTSASTHSPRTSNTFYSGPWAWQESETALPTPSWETANPTPLMVVMEVIHSSEVEAMIR